MYACVYFFFRTPLMWDKHAWNMIAFNIVFNDKLTHKLHMQSGFCTVRDVESSIQNWHLSNFKSVIHVQRGFPTWMWSQCQMRLLNAGGVTKTSISLRSIPLRTTWTQDRSHHNCRYWLQYAVLWPLITLSCLYTVLVEPQVHATFSPHFYHCRDSPK